MERELWPLLYRELRRAAGDFSQKYVQIPAWVLVAVSLWAALHDRPVAWACDPANWGATTMRPWKLPSPSTMSRRAYSVGTGLLWRALQERLRRLGPGPALVASLDGKPLPVGGYTKDPDAAYGRGAGVMAKGYKLHTVWSSGALPGEWEVASLKVGETTVAGEMLGASGRGAAGAATCWRTATTTPAGCSTRRRRRATSWWCRSGGGRGQGAPLPEPAPAALHRTDAGPGQVGLRAVAVQDEDGHREGVRQRDLVRRRDGAAAGVGAPGVAGPHLGLGQAPHQRRQDHQKS